jgi:hypothetical protein
MLLELQGGYGGCALCMMVMFQAGLATGRIVCGWPICTSVRHVGHVG